MDAQRVYRSTRIAHGVSEVENSSLQERQHILAKFEELKTTEEGRRREYIEAAQIVLEEDRSRDVSTGEIYAPDNSTPGASSSSSKTSRLV